MALDVEDQYREKAQQFLHDFMEFATEQFGERCQEYDEGCSCCKLWDLFDKVYEIVDI